jgi:CHASE2 domain-containing sensor protein
MTHRHRSPWLPTWWDAILLGIILISGFFLDDPAIKKHVPWLVGLQMGAHTLMSGLSPLGGTSPRRVSVVEIDDSAFWSPPLNGVQPTDRAYLASLVNAAAKAGASVIGLDFQLKSPSNVPADSPSRAAANQKLMEAVAAAGQAHVPIVLTAGLVLDGDQWRREPNICDDRDKDGPFFSESGSNPLKRAVSPPDPGSTACDILSKLSSVSVGYINLPADRREVPLQFQADEFDGATSVDFSSFAWQIVSAYAAELDLAGSPPDCQGNPQGFPAFCEALALMRQHDFAYAGFISRSGFERYTVRARDLLAASQSPPAQWEASPERGELKGRIVLIGATWHEFGQGRGPLVDAYSSPAGQMPGVYLHANYVEAILRGLALPVSRTWSRIIELLAGYLLIVLMHSRRGFAQWLIVWLAGSALLAALALLLSFWGWYLDFSLISALLLVHVFVEHYEHLRQHAQQGGY